MIIAISVYSFRTMQAVDEAWISFRLMRAERYVYFVSGFKGQGNLYRLDLEGDGHAKLFWGGKQVCHGISKVRNGRIMAAAAKSTVPEFYAVLDAKTGELLDIAVQSAQKLLDEVKLSEPEDFFFSTLDGESHVHGFCHDAA